MLDGTMLLAVGNEFTKEYIENRARTAVSRALSDALGREARFAITVDASVSTELEPIQPTAPEPEEQRPTLTLVPPHDDHRAPTPAPSSARGRGPLVEPARLHPRYVFETFVIGASNRFAHAAAVAVAEAPANAYNPLFIYGGSGLGKTHLLHAIGHYAQNLYSGIRVRYVNSEEFTNDFINSISEGKAGAFQRRYRDTDILLIDDIQFLQGKEQTMEEFFHTFNTL
ncbi:MAG: ATP-binding protein, partial [Actinobacteria bacterium]|nr:ATP-binding protein [Actinomycetota bacterium]